MQIETGGLQVLEQAFNRKSKSLVVVFDDISRLVQVAEQVDGVLMFAGFTPAQKVNILESFSRKFQVRDEQAIFAGCRSDHLGLETFTVFIQRVSQAVLST